MSDTFSGYDLETGLLQRVRRWRDALPVLILLDALRVAGSPLYVGISLVAVLVSRAIFSGGEVAATQVVLFLGSGGQEAALAQTASLVAWPDMSASGRWMIAVGSMHPVRTLIVLGVWAFPAAAMARAGACYAAGRDQSFLQNTSTAGKRLPWLWLIAIMPLSGTLGLATVMVAVGLLARAGRVGVWLSELGALLALPIVILIGLIAAGSLAAIPLGWAAMVIEKRCDVFDSLSRGYEYLLRRPVHLLFYGVCSYALATICFYLARAISAAALAIATSAARFGSGASWSPTGFQNVIQCIPVAVGIAAAWGLVGATYLLMRQAANQQEVEDIAVSPIDRREAELPTLQPDAVETAR